MRASTRLAAVAAFLLLAAVRPHAQTGISLPCSTDEQGFTVCVRQFTAEPQEDGSTLVTEMQPGQTFEGVLQTYLQTCLSTVWTMRVTFDAGGSPAATFERLPPVPTFSVVALADVTPPATWVPYAYVVEVDGGALESHATAADVEKRLAEVWADGNPCHVVRAHYLAWKPYDRPAEQLWSVTTLSRPADVRYSY